MSFHTSIPFLALLLAGIVPGCSKSSGPDLGEVTGTVTLDGRPLEGASLNFVPQGTGSMTSGRASVGVTDAQGKYTLGYSGTKSGAMKR